MEIYIEHQHTPPHFFSPKSIYFVTGATTKIQRCLRVDSLKDHFVRTLFEESNRNYWELHAWVVLENHYHFVAKAPEDATTLTQLIRAVHSRSGKYINKFDGVTGRRVWYNYWDSCITNETSYLARLHYVIMNPVKHGLVEEPEDYSFSSYEWFLKNAELEFQQRVLYQPIDRIIVHDDF